MMGDTLHLSHYVMLKAALWSCDEKTYLDTGMALVRDGVKMDEIESASLFILDNANPEVHAYWNKQEPT